MPSYEEVTRRAGSLRSMTGFTEAEFMALLPHFGHALGTYLQDRPMDGQPRTSRRYSMYGTCPLPTIADTVLFILIYVKQNPIQEGEGQLCGKKTCHTLKNLLVITETCHLCSSSHTTEGQTGGGSRQVKHASPGGLPRVSPLTFLRRVCSTCSVNRSLPIGVPDGVPCLIRANASAGSPASPTVRDASRRCGSVCPTCTDASWGLMMQLVSPKALAA